MLNKSIEEIHELLEYEKKQIKYQEDKYRYTSIFHEIDFEVIDFCKTIKNDKFLMTIGTTETLNKNLLHKFTSISSVGSYLEKTLKNNYYIINIMKLLSNKFKINI